MIPFARSSQHPNVFLFDTRNGTELKTFDTELVTRSIAVSCGRLFAVDSGEVGLISNHDPKMKVFDLGTGKVVGQLSGRESGVRFVVAAARNANIITAFTGKIKRGFDWLDITSYSYAEDTTFTVWNSNTLQQLITSPKVNGLADLRLSADGKHVLFYGATPYAPPFGGSVQVFDIQ